MNRHQGLFIINSADINHLMIINDSVGLNEWSIYEKAKAGLRELEG